MVQMCSAYGCRNRSKKNSGITFHKFPSFKKAALRKKWIFAMKRKEFDCISRSPVATELVDGHARFVSELILIWNWLAVPLFTYVSCPHFFRWRHGIKDNQLTFNSFRRDKQIIKKWPFPLLNFLGLTIGMVWNIARDEARGNDEKLFKMCALMYKQVLNRIYPCGSGGQNQNSK